VWNEGRHWSYMDFVNPDMDMRGVEPGLAKPLGYFYRIGPPDHGSGIGGMYQTLSPYNHVVEDASFAKLRELSLTYHVGRVGGFGNWDVSLIGRNLFTITDYSGFDPEVGFGGGSTASSTINAVDAYVFPNLRPSPSAPPPSFSGGAAPGGRAHPAAAGGTPPCGGYRWVSSSVRCPGRSWRWRCSPPARTR